MKYYLIAGERSGDLHGGNLIKALRQQDPSAILKGFGGDKMSEAGMELSMHYSKMAFMGFAAVVANLNTISKLLAYCKQDIVSFQPDVVILIDYAGFNLRIARFAKTKGLKVYYYISPKVWAWNTGRAWKLKANVDKMFCILPFEKEFFKKFNWEVDYVGNPVLDAVKAYRPDKNFLTTHDIPPGKKIIALLPGSRIIELKRMIPVMAEVVKRNIEFQFVVAAVKELPHKLYEPLLKIGSVRFVYDATYDLLSHAQAAIVTSGTATLETGLLKVPQVVIYKAAGWEYPLLKWLIKVNYISLINLIANTLVIKELIQHDMTVQNLDAELKRIANDGSHRNQILQGYDEVYRTLDTGSASENAARLMFKYLSQAG